MRTDIKPSLNARNSIELYTNIDQTLVHSLHGLWNCEIGGLYCIGPCNLFWSIRSMFSYNRNDDCLPTMSTL